MAVLEKKHLRENTSWAVIYMGMKNTWTIADIPNAKYNASIHSLKVHLCGKSWIYDYCSGNGYL